MTTYAISPELAGWTPKRKVSQYLFLGGLFAALQIAFDLLFRSSSIGELTLDVIGAIISGAIFAVVFVALTRPNRGYKIIVSDDRITAVHPSFQRFVERGHVRSVIETPGNFLRAPTLRISKHGKLGTWFWGGVSIPRALPDCDSIRDLALQWQVSSFPAAPTPE